MPERQPEYINIDGRDVEMVRVKDRKSQHEMTLTRDNAEQLKSSVDVVDKAALDSNGAPLPAKPHVAKGVSNPAPVASSKEDSK